MAITKKGSKKIIVRGIVFRWRVNAYRIKSVWKSGKETLSNEYLAAATPFRLGDVQDIVFNVPVELYDQPVSKIMITGFSHCIDGFMGPEQIMEIKPKTIANIIERMLDDGWDPSKKGDRNAELHDHNDDKHNPIVLIIPGVINTDLAGCTNAAKAKRPI